MKRSLYVVLKFIIILILTCASSFIRANSDSTIIFIKNFKLKISCRKVQNDSLKISIQNLCNKEIYFALGNHTYPARKGDTLIVFHGLYENPLEDIHYYSLFVLKPKEVCEIDTEGLEINYLKIYLTALIEQKYVKHKFDKKKNKYSYKIENTVYHRMKRKYLLLLKVPIH